MTKLIIIIIIIICVPVFLYGSELWDISSRQLLLLERAHRKILRTLMGLPARCRVSALLGLLGAHSFASLISQCQLSFIHSFSLMSTDALPRCILALRLANHGRGSVLHTWSQLLRRHSLPDIDEILASSISVYGWRRYVHSRLVAESHAVVSTECSHLPLGHCLVPGRPIPHWGITLSSVIATRRSFLRVRLLVGCGDLMDDLVHFHGASSSACPLCHYVCEDALHFIAVCPHLHSAHLTFLASAPPSISFVAHDSQQLCDVVPGLCWIPDLSVQIFLIDFIHFLWEQHSLALS